jgi:hypothetical protein
MEFFNKMKSEYNEARGWYRLWFSTWTYHHCEFFLFQKHGMNSSARLRIGFPDAADSSYDFSPRPPEYLPPDGPISHDEYHFHYYYNTCPSYMSWTRWFASSYLINTGPSTANCTALTAVPKRMTKLDMENGKRAPPCAFSISPWSSSSSCGFTNGDTDLICRVRPFRSICRCR